MIRKIALTGGIATGKSYVASRLREAGVPIVDADVLAREVVAPGTAGLRAIVERFGPDVRAPRRHPGSRPGSAQIVFKDSAARRDLEAIIHPAVQRRHRRFLRRRCRKRRRLRWPTSRCCSRPGAQGSSTSVVVVGVPARRCSSSG